MSWHTLLPLSTGPAITKSLQQLANAQSKSERQQALHVLAQKLRGPVGQTFLTRLLQNKSATARHLMMELIRRLPLPIEARFRQVVIPWLAEKRFSPSLRLAVALALIRSASHDPVEIETVITALLTNTSPRSQIARLEYLRDKLGSSAVLEKMLAAADSALSLRCPRCPVTLNRRDFAKHVWESHGLLFDGRRVREPWDLVADRVAEYAETGELTKLDSAMELGQSLDAVDGLVRVHRLLYKHSKTRVEGERGLRSEATRRRSVVCGNCLAMIPCPEVRPTFPAAVSRGRLTAGQFTVAIDESGLVTQLLVQTPSATLYFGCEPHSVLTRRGGLLLLVAPFVMLALAAAWAMPAGLNLPLLTTGLLIALAFLAYLRLRRKWRQVPPVDERAIDTAWALIAQRLLESPVAEELDFAAALAASSVGRGTPAWRAGHLLWLAEQCKRYLRESKASPAQYAALARLRIADAARLGRDPVRLLVEMLTPCLSGELPLDCAELLLWPGLLAESAGGRARLRILLAESAFMAGLEVGDIQELAKLAPLLGASLGASDADGLAMLRHLWVNRLACPWLASCGVATTVFELAHFPPSFGGQFLHARPDLLLFQPGPEPILICTNGVWLSDTHVPGPETPMTFRKKSNSPGSGGEVLIDSIRVSVRGDPQDLVKRLRSWVKFFARDFLPNVDRVLSWREHAALQKLLVQKRGKCPQCHKAILYMLGEISEG